jgi:hypothetical protein
VSVRPADYPPPLDPVGEFVSGPTDPDGERIEVGVVIVGGGPAGLACAIRLMQLLETEPALAESLGEVPVAVVEKGRSTGSHLLSGAMMEPSAMRRLFPDLDERSWPTYGPVQREAVYLMTSRRALRLPRVPPPFRNHGNHVTSIAQLGRWLGERAEQAGVYILPETSAYRLLVQDGAVLEVRSGDKGRGPDPQEWELGVKEVWEVPSVFLSGNATRDDAPNHIRIERKVPLAVGLMWQHMCPAGVYEVPEEALEQVGFAGGTSDSALVDVHVTPSNCIQCGAITATGGRLTPAEGGDGPNYQVT